MANIGDLVSAATYNAIVNKINLVLGVGDGAQQGYGRTVKSFTVDSDTVISSALMQNLYDDLTRARTHQRGSSFTWDTPADGINTPSSGEFIGIFAADLGVSGTSADATADLAEGFLDFEQAAQDIVDDQYDVAGDQVAITLKDTSTISTAWNGTIRHTVTVTWTNANERRYFFNSGGYIQFDASLSGGTSVAGDETNTPPGTKDEIWQTMLSNMGAIRFGRTATTATGTGTTTNVGNYDITTNTPTRIFTKDGSGVYAENQYYIDAWQTAANSIRFDIVFVDNDTGDDTATDLGFPGQGAPVDENVTGTITSNVTTRTASAGVLDLNEPAVSTNTELTGGAGGVTYVLGANSTAVNEGTTVVITISGSVPNGTIVPWSMSGISTSDISLTSLNGSFSIQSGTAQLSFTVLNDAVTEGTETITFTSGGQSIDIEIADTSRGAVYSLSAGANNVDEGSSITFTMDTQNVNPGNIPYTITGIDAADLSVGTLTGNIVTSGNYSSATGSVTLTLAADNTSEGAETITFSAGGKSVNVTVNDTSATSVSGWPSQPLVGWGNRFLQLSTSAYTLCETFAGINFTHDFSNNRVTIDGYTWDNRSNAPLNTGYINYTGYTSPTVEVRFFQSNVVRTHAQINQEDYTYDPTTLPTPGAAQSTGTWYAVPSNQFIQFYWQAGEFIVQGLNNNDASEQSVSILTADNVSFEVRISEAGKPTIVRTSPVQSINLRADLFSDDPV